MIFRTFGTLKWQRIRGSGRIRNLFMMDAGKSESNNFSRSSRRGRRMTGNSSKKSLKSKDKIR